MKAFDIVNLLSERMPLYTSAFSEYVDITSITPSGNTASVVTASQHNMVDGQNVPILGASAPVQIESLTRVGTFATIKTVQDHDLTLSQRDKANGGKVVNIAGATETEFNDEFLLLSVNNRREIVIAVDDSGATSINGAPIIEDAAVNIYNGLFPVSNISQFGFDYQLPVAYSLAAVGSMKALVSIRIAACLDINRYVRDIYTKDTVGDATIVVQLGDVTRSKDKRETSDASDSISGEYHYNPTFIQPFAIYIIQNVTQDLDGATARDLVESTYVPAVFKSIERAKLETGFTHSQYGATCTEHGVFSFDELASQGTALYVHEIVFEQLCTIDKVADTVPSQATVALRNIEFEIKSDKGSGILIADIDLDDMPLP